jgi:hypothetical protein
MVISYQTNFFGEETLDNSCLIRMVTKGQNGKGSGTGSNPKIG